MSKYFSNIDIWNPTTMRIEFEMAVAKHMARFERDHECKSPLDKIIKECSHGKLNGRTMKDFLCPHGEIPTSSNIIRIFTVIRIITDSDSEFINDDIYLLGIFLDDKASVKINETIDQIKEDTKKKCKEINEEYYVKVYQRLYRLRIQIFSTYNSWATSGQGLGLRSSGIKNLYVIAIKSLDQGVRSVSREIWDELIFGGTSKNSRFLLDAI